jgi:ATP-dependent RNA helicase DDX10/DBP4
MRSIYLHKDKTVFKLAELPAERFAESLGLPGVPKIRFLSKEVAKAKKNASRGVNAEDSAINEGETFDGNENDSDIGTGSEEDDAEAELHTSSEEEAGTENDTTTANKPSKVISAPSIQCQVSLTLTFITQARSPHQIRSNVRAKKSDHPFDTL